MFVVVVVVFPPNFCSIWICIISWSLWLSRDKNWYSRTLVSSTHLWDLWLSPLTTFYWTLQRISDRRDSSDVVAQIRCLFSLFWNSKPCAWHLGSCSTLIQFKANYSHLCQRGLHNGCTLVKPLSATIVLRHTTVTHVATFIRGTGSALIS